MSSAVRRGTTLDSMSPAKDDGCRADHVDGRHLVGRKTEPRNVALQVELQRGRAQTTQCGIDDRLVGAGAHGRPDDGQRVERDDLRTAPILECVDVLIEAILRVAGQREKERHLAVGLYLQPLHEVRAIDHAGAHEVLAVQVAAARKRGQGRVERFLAEDAELEEDASEVSDGLASADLRRLSLEK